MTKILKSTLGTAASDARHCYCDMFLYQFTGGFQVDSPVKIQVARKLARCAPPYTDRAREEPWDGGADTGASPHYWQVRYARRVPWAAVIGAKLP